MNIHDVNDVQSYKLGDAMFDEDDIFSPQVSLKKYTSVIIRVCHSRSGFLSCMYINDDFMTKSRYSYLCCHRSVP